MLGHINWQHHARTHTYINFFFVCVRICGMCACVNGCVRSHVHSCVQRSEVYGANKMYFMLP